jgi:hypothetical protein
MMRLQWFAVALMIFGALAVGQTAGALEFTRPITAPLSLSSPTHLNSGDGSLNIWASTDDHNLTGTLWEDDDTGTGDAQCHMIYDLGRMTDITQVRLTTRNDPHFPRHLPENADIYYFLDGVPYNSDDIEGDANIQFVGNYDIPQIGGGASTDVDVADFSARYVGMRVNKSWNNDNCQLSGIAFETPDAVPLRSPLIAYHSSATDPGNCVDNDFETHAVFSDDDVGTMGVQGHIIFDLGEATEVGGLKLKVPPSGTWNAYINPKDVDFYYFVDDVASDSDDIEGDDNIVLINSHAFTALRRNFGSPAGGYPEFTYFDNEVEKRYIGMRVNTSHGATDFEMAEIELFAGGSFVPPPPIPGDANEDDIVNDKDASILAAHWQTGPGANWGDGDFNNDGFVNDEDAAILAAHWLKTGENYGAVPEPTTVVMLLGGLLSLWIWRRR